MYYKYFLECLNIIFSYKMIQKIFINIKVKLTVKLLELLMALEKRMLQFFLLKYAEILF